MYTDASKYSESQCVCAKQSHELHLTPSGNCLAAVCTGKAGVNKQIADVSQHVVSLVHARGGWRWQK